ncbi:MAG: S16 family serine protease [Candidatus Woesearchaeota archaeon]
MKMMKKLFLLFIAFLLVFPLVSAREGHMKLLAVREANNEGSAADLYLEVVPGKGRVFIETVPLSKMDTQISTRFAKDIACDYLERDCSRYDFFYAINADSPIIGGPSAGAAIAILTVAILEDIKVDDSISMTGTINSGGVIGPVGGLTAKIEAASSVGIKTVLIPKGERFLKEELNLTVDVADYAKNFGIDVVEVGDLTEALYYFTGKEFKKDVPELELDENYVDTMKYLAEDLCNRTDKLQKRFSGLALNASLVDEDVISDQESAMELKKVGEGAFEREMYYSAASNCFGSNVKYKKLLLKLDGYDNIDDVEEDIRNFEMIVDKIPVETLTDLQAYMVVKERLKDAATSFAEAKVLYDEEKDYSSELAYAIERIYSAESWSNFFGVGGKQFKFDNEILEQSCIKKISEAEERYNYAKIYFPTTLKNTKEELALAYEDYTNGNFELCLFKASKVKADANVVLGVIGVADKQLDIVLDIKLNAVKRIIVEQQQKDVFPILGYSYYEYSQHLREDNKISALIYAEYALELSNLDIYFDNNKRFVAINDFDSEKLMLLLGGILIGAFAVLLVKKKGVKKRKKTRLF